MNEEEINNIGHQIQNTYIEPLEVMTNSRICLDTQLSPRYSFYQSCFLFFENNFHTFENKVTSLRISKEDGHCYN